MLQVIHALSPVHAQVKGVLHRDQNIDVVESVQGLRNADEIALMAADRAEADPASYTSVIT